MKVCETAGFPRVASQVLPLPKVGSQVGRFSRVFTRVWTFPWVGSQTCWDGFVDIYIGWNGLACSKVELDWLVDCEVGGGLCPVSVLQSPSCHKLTVVRELGTLAGGGSVVSYGLAPSYGGSWEGDGREAGSGQGRWVAALSYGHFCWGE